MIVSLLYVILAALALGFLIFIHELGHYWMAKKVGMKVDAFGIGFGKPLYSWERKGVKWHIGWLPFGGYVKIAGMDGDSDRDDVPGGFFSKSPKDRIKVAFMGPLVNLIFAFLMFTIIWATGGRQKGFSEFTTKVGWVDPKSELYALGVRPGDEISSYDHHPYNSAKDHLYGPMMASSTIEVKGNKVDYQSGNKTPFDYTVKPYDHPVSIEKGILTAGILHSASYVVYSPTEENSIEHVLPEGSPMQDSGIESGDRLVWVDGVPLYSFQQLGHILNDGRALLTIQRGQQRFLRRVPRVRIEELKLDANLKEEFVDWQHEAQLAGEKTTRLYAIPYNLSPDCFVESSLKLIDKEKQKEIFPEHVFSDLELPLEVGDKVLAVDGIPIKYAYQLLFQLQQRKVSIIVERNPEILKSSSWKNADQQFDREVDWADLQKIASAIGNGVPVKSIGNLVLLKPIVPKMRSEFALSPEKQAQVATTLMEQKKAIAAIEDPEKRSQAIQQLETQEKQLLLGLPGIQDKKVIYNPTPMQQFSGVFEEIWRTLIALFSGYLNPKWMAGPIGIVQVVHDSWMIGFKEALFWLGAISLNLGILNLLPIPVLDGGYICLFTLEMITKKKMKAKTLERLIIPFVILVAAFFIYTTYNDLSRLISGFFKW